MMCVVKHKEFLHRHIDSGHVYCSYWICLDLISKWALNCYGVRERAQAQLLRFLRVIMDHILTEVARLGFQVCPKPMRLSRRLVCVDEPKFYDIWLSMA